MRNLPRDHWAGLYELSPSGNDMARGMIWHEEWYCLKNDMAWRMIWHEEWYGTRNDIGTEEWYGMKNDMARGMIWHEEWYCLKNDMAWRMIWHEEWYGTRNDMAWGMIWHEEWYGMRNDIAWRMIWHEEWYGTRNWYGTKNDMAWGMIWHKGRVQEIWAEIGGRWEKANVVQGMGSWLVSRWSGQQGHWRRIDENQRAGDLFMDGGCCWVHATILSICFLDVPSKISRSVFQLIIQIQCMFVYK